MNKRKKTVYLAGPLFTHAELEYNLELKDMMFKKGFSVFLPQTDAEDAATEREKQNQEYILKKCLE
jgi:nucleoside 2-deoxyribosyltransferase